MLSTCFWECFPCRIGADAQGSIKNSVFFINLYSNMESSYSSEVIFIWKTWPLLVHFSSVFNFCYIETGPYYVRYKYQVPFRKFFQFELWSVFCSFDALLIYVKEHKILIF